MKNHSDVMRDIWKTASTYHFLHTLALGLAASQASNLNIRKRNIVCGLFTGGMLLFSGSLYVVVFMNERKPYSYPAPFGGIMLMAGWLAFGFL